MWDERYSDAFNAYGTKPNDFLADVADSIPTGDVLCLAEGEGRNAVFLAEKGYTVTAMDQSSVGLENAQRLARERGVTLVTEVADLADFELGEARWSGVVAIWAHLPPALRQRVHSSVVRSLKPGGVFVLEAYTPDQLNQPGRGGPPVAELLMEAAKLRTELEGLNFEILREVVRDVQEGEYHKGVSATVQLVGRKR